MLAKLKSCTVIGVNGLLIDVEVDVALGLPAFQTVGLPDNSVRESKDRVKSAIKNCGYDFPSRRITVNLAPADIKKEGTGFDLPMALGILAATGLIPVDKLQGFCVIGEMSLDGGVRKTSGILPVLLASIDEGLSGALIPFENVDEARIVANQVNVYTVSSLQEAVDFFLGKMELRPVEYTSSTQSDLENYLCDFAEVKGQRHVKRALEIAASGNHNILLQGPPGTGKTMLARRLSTILPEMTHDEIIETTKVYSVSGIPGESVGIRQIRPFRSPHHTVSDAGLIGGGANPRPGEVSLAHNGVLFLDELPEFKKSVLEVLRQPMEDGKVTISRANMTLTFPSRFLLVAALNPCPCGYKGDTAKECACTEIAIQRYTSRISGPLLDRIDLHVEVGRVEYADLQQEKQVETSQIIRQRVNRTREIQTRRFAEMPGIYCNAMMGTKEIERFCSLSPECSNLLQKGLERLGLSARGYHRILKVARTLADMSESASIEPAHIAEAIQYRRLTFF